MNLGGNSWVSACVKLGVALSTFISNLPALRRHSHTAFINRSPLHRNVPRDDAVRSEFPVISALFDTDYGDVGTFDANVDGEDDMVVKTAQLIAPGTPPGPVSALHATEQQAGGGVGSKGKKGKGKECLLQ